MDKIELRELTTAGAFASFTSVFQPNTMCIQQFSCCLMNDKNFSFYHVSWLQFVIFLKLFYKLITLYN